MSTGDLALLTLAICIGGLVIWLLVRTRRGPRVSYGTPASVHDLGTRFHTLWHRRIRAGEWRPLLVYMYSGRDGYKGAMADFEKRLSPSIEYGASEAVARLEEGAEVTILPELDGFVFNPPAATVLWLETWHCIEFRMMAQESAQGLARGRIVFLVGPLVVAETEIAIEIMDDASVPATSIPADLYSDDRLSGADSAAYRTIFVSYSHEDTPIVRQLERAYRAIGDSYLRDVNILRSGERWGPALLNMITRADIFQLCWSTAASRSRNVEQEWRHAFKLQRRNFIRPVFWEKPMPEPPSELSELHFSFIEIAP